VMLAVTQVGDQKGGVGAGHGSCVHYLQHTLS
jgi:ribosomal protein S5